MLRKSERSNVVCSLIVPVRKPFPRGLNGTKPLPSSSRVGDTKEELPVNDSLHCDFAVYSLTLFKQAGINESDGVLTFGLSPPTRCATRWSIQMKWLQAVSHRFHGCCTET